MEFNISISGKWEDDIWDPYMIPTPPFFVLDFIRSQYPVAMPQNIEAGNFYKDKKNEKRKKELKFSIPMDMEDLARECGYFENGLEIQIIVPTFWANQFVLPSVSRKNYIYVFEWEFSPEKFLKRWKVDGFPLSYYKEDEK